MEGVAGLDAPLDVLVVEDDDDYATLVVTWLERNPSLAVRVRRSADVRSAMRALEQPTDVLLLDLSLPDGDGLATVRRMVQHTDAAVIVLTGTKDDRIGLEAVRIGVQEYLVKDATTAELLVRAVRYAVERRRLVHEVDALREARARERELREMERVAAERPASVTAATYGDRDVAATLGSRYAQLQQDYADVLERMLESRVYRTDYHPNEDLQAIGRLLGFIRARPRDVVELHRGVLRKLAAGTTVQRSQALVTEGRLAVLELMGHVLAYYRSRATTLPDRAHAWGDDA